uniref:Serine palmitoyltransferase small subunit A n=1 Tax=Fundulus heteroclitus TaxID=8078 RepID=A0A3Q2NTI5_FUNHE
MCPAFPRLWLAIICLIIILVYIEYDREPVELMYRYSLLISVAAMAIYTGYVFMPQHIMAILHYFEVVQ